MQQGLRIGSYVSGECLGGAPFRDLQAAFGIIYPNVTFLRAKHAVADHKCGQIGQLHLVTIGTTVAIALVCE